MQTIGSLGRTDPVLCDITTEITLKSEIACSANLCNTNGSCSSHESNSRRLTTASSSIGLVSPTNETMLPQPSKSLNFRKSSGIILSSSILMCTATLCHRRKSLESNGRPNRSSLAAKSGEHGRCC